MGREERKDEGIAALESALLALTKEKDAADDEARREALSGRPPLRPSRPSTEIERLRRALASARLPA
jgi:hypothetical protein